MSKLIALIYADTRIPAEIYSEVQNLQTTGQLDLIDIAEVEVKENGKLKFEQAMSNPVVGHSEGMFLPALIGLLFFNPGVSVNDTVRKTIAEIALDASFVKDILSESSPQNSILFLYLQGDLGEGVASRLSQHGGKVLQMALSGQQIERLESLFRGHRFLDTQETILHAP